ncbi:MAG: hypothetical protein SVY10_15815 [Thermodesulfobacteriota bacterium]|nr:hypothetical protein [Thermodesulfobacteriota bacterium]
MDCQVQKREVGEFFPHRWLSEKFAKALDNKAIVWYFSAVMNEGSLTCAVKPTIDYQPDYRLSDESIRKDTYYLHYPFVFSIYPEYL